MTHVELLIINEIRKSLNELQKDGVGFIDRDEHDTNMIYRIDNSKILISVETIDKQ